MQARWPAFFAALLLCGCATTPDTTSHAELSPVSRPPAKGQHASASTVPARIEEAPATSSPAPAPVVDRSAYPWLSDNTCAQQAVAEPLITKVAPPAGFSRVSAQPESFGAWLRALPLRPRGPVIDYKGRVILEEDDPRLFAVVAMDEGKADLQQCADSIMRLFAEWQWSRGSRRISYRAASGTPMPLASWLSGQRPVPSKSGMSIVWKPSARAADKDDHAAFREYLDAVFMWANTGALARDAKKIDLAELSPGDFFVLAGSPGHAVLVLDVAKNEQGKTAVLLGQGYMPAQSFHVLRPASGAVWFTIDEASGGLMTPFWPDPFPWSSLRRLES